MKVSYYSYISRVLKIIHQSCSLLWVASTPFSLFLLVKLSLPTVEWRLSEVASLLSVDQPSGVMKVSRWSPSCLLLMKVQTKDELNLTHLYRTYSCRNIINIYLELLSTIMSMNSQARNVWKHYLKYGTLFHNYSYHFHAILNSSATQFTIDRTLRRFRIRPGELRLSDLGLRLFQSILRRWFHRYQIRRKKSEWIEVLTYTVMKSEWIELLSVFLASHTPYDN